MKSRISLLPFALGLCLLPVLAGCGVLGGAATLRTAREAYDADNFAGAKEHLEHFLDSDPTNEDLYRAHRMLADCYLRLPEGRNVPRALKHYEAAVAVQAPAEVRRAALRRGADLLFEQGQYGNAAEWYGRLVLLLEGQPQQATAYRRAGVSSRRAGKWKASRDYFEHLFLSFPRSTHAGTARRALAWKENGFAIEFAQHVSSLEALAIHDRVDNDGIITTVAPGIRGGRAVFIVRLTELFPTFKEAVLALQRIQRQGYDFAAIYPQ